jgi:membrane protease YdiL (CAAX protease family)
MAWLLGAFLEEAVLRGIVLQTIQATLRGSALSPMASEIAIFGAAILAGSIHLYQGPRGAIIILQLSILFGVLFVISGNNIWSVILCHGLYDTIAFIRFASRKSRYSST